MRRRISQVRADRAVDKKQTHTHTHKERNLIREESLTAARLESREQESWLKLTTETLSKRMSAYENDVLTFLCFL